MRYYKIKVVPEKLYLYLRIKGNVRNKFLKYRIILTVRFVNVVKPVPAYSGRSRSENKVER